MKQNQVVRAALDASDPLVLFMCCSGAVVLQESSLPGMTSLKDMAQNVANSAGLKVQQDAQQQQQDLSAPNMAAKSMYDHTSAPASAGGVLPQLSNSSTMAAGGAPGDLLTSSASTTSLAPEQGVSIQLNPIISVSPLGIVPFTKEHLRQSGESRPIESNQASVDCDAYRCWLQLCWTQRPCTCRTRPTRSDCVSTCLATPVPVRRTTRSRRCRTATRWRHTRASAPRRSSSSSTTWKYVSQCTLPYLKHKRFRSCFILRNYVAAGNKGSVFSGEGAQEAVVAVSHQVHDVVPATRRTQSDHRGV